MRSSEKFISAVILVSLVFLIPLTLHAGWSWSFPFNSGEPLPTAESTPRETEGAVKPPPPPAVKLTRPADSLSPLKSPVSVISAPPLPEVSSSATGSQSIVPESSRLLALFVPAFKFGSTVINEDTVWSGAVQVNGMVTVATQATLTISPGTVIRFGLNSGMLVLGRITAKGSAQTPVLFSSLYAEPRASDWYGIVLTGTGKRNIFEEVRMDGAETAIYARSSSMEAKKVRLENSSTGIRLIDSIAAFKDASIAECSTGFTAEKSDVELEAVTLAKGKIGVSLISSALTADKLKISSFTQSAFTADKSQLKVVDSLFTTNCAGAGVSESTGSITNSIFSANTEAGVTLRGSALRFNANLVTANKIGLQLEDSLPAVWGNSIHGNRNYNLLYLGDERIYLGGNWLGKANGDAMDKFIFSRRPGAVLTFPVLVSDPLAAAEIDR